MIDVFGVRFDTVSELAFSLGYTRSLSKNFIKKQYGSFEGLVLTRLHVRDDEAPAALLKARDAYRSASSAKKDDLTQSKSADACDADLLAVKAFFRVALADLASEKKDDLLKLVALSLNMSVEALKSDLESFLS